MIVVLGFAIGILTGFLGVGGGSIIMPSLLLLGISTNIAVGTSLATVTLGVSLATFRHSKMKNIDFRLGIILAVGALIGMFFGIALVELLKSLKSLDFVVNLIYTIMLYIITLFSSRESILSIKRKYANLKPRNRGVGRMCTSTLYKPLVIGILVGVLCGFLGIGGGILYIPLLTYVLGIPTLTAIGTSLLTVLISGIPGTIGHLIYGNVDLMIALLLFIGMSLGTQIGVTSTKYVRPAYIRLMYSSCIGLVAISLTLRLITNYLLHTQTLLKISQIVLIYGVIALSVLILIYGITLKIKSTIT